MSKMHPERDESRGGRIFAAVFKTGLILGAVICALALLGQGEGVLHMPVLEAMR